MQKLKAVAERLTGPEIIDPRAAASRENHRVINHGGQQRAAGACEKCWEMLGAAARPAQKPQRGGGTTSCASRPSAGIDRAKCLIPLKATGEQEIISSLVDAADRATPGRGRRGSGNRNVVPGPGPPACNFSLRFFLEMLKMLDRCERCG